MHLIQKINLYPFIVACFLSVVLFGCCAQNNKKEISLENTVVLPGANQTEKYLHLFDGNAIALVANHTSVIFKSADNQTYTHLVDSLTTHNINIVKVFAPEHGFRGKADAGEHIADSRDPKTGIPILSLYGSNKKLKASQLSGVDFVVFDIQDVGTRFFTYLSTLHYVMEACAKQNIPVLLLDRPNPNGYYIDGPILETAHKSFVGLHPVPIVYGMTIGEYAQMINGEKWLAEGIQCDLRIIPIKNYSHTTEYKLPIKPSPNLPNAKSVNLYPSLCLFEGTDVSCGRGTEMQFQIFGSPNLNTEHYGLSFIPQPNIGSKYPKHQEKTCFGKDLRATTYLKGLNFNWLIDAYNNTSNQKEFFNSFFTNLAGTKKLQQQIEAGATFKEISASWQTNLNKFKTVRKKYLIYGDFYQDED